MQQLNIKVGEVIQFTGKPVTQRWERKSANHHRNMFTTFKCSDGSYIRLNSSAKRISSLELHTSVSVSGVVKTVSSDAVDGKMVITLSLNNMVVGGISNV